MTSSMDRPLLRRRPGDDAHQAPVGGAGQQDAVHSHVLAPARAAVRQAHRLARQHAPAEPRDPQRRESSLPPLRVAPTEGGQHRVPELGGIGLAPGEEAERRGARGDLPGERGLREVDPDPEHHVLDLLAPGGGGLGEYSGDLAPVRQ
jgi:hypothetical protein